jgi:hypothetical protein
MAGFLAPSHRNKPSRGNWLRASPTAEWDGSLPPSSADFQQLAGDIFAAPANVVFAGFGRIDWMNAPFETVA